MKLWGGRFREAESADMESFNSSLDFDKRLFSEDIEGSMAHVKMLGKCSILSAEEVEKILEGLQSIKSDIESGELIISGDYEDIHSFVEINLIKKIGETAKKLHTARSRNDQVALDFKMFCKNSAKIILKEIKLDEDIRDADFVITGEGKLDFQTAMGKAPVGVAKLAKKYGRKVIAFAGGTTKDAVRCNEEGIDAYFSILQLPMTVEEAMEFDTARKNLTSTAEQVFRLIKAVQA
jgi:NADPH-dependent curcumin reductase CurA